jgi:cell division protein FtsB
MREENKKTFQWPIKTILFLVLIILMIFGYLVSKEISKKNKINDEIEVLKREAERIKKENMQLEERIVYLGSDEYREKEAKEKLNLQKPDEKLIIITQNSPFKEEEARSEKENEKKNFYQKVESMSNLKKWWNYFFN